MILRRLGVLVLSTPIFVLVAWVGHLFGWPTWVPGIAWALAAAVALGPFVMPKLGETDAVDVVRRELASGPAPPRPRLKGDPGLRPTPRLSGTDPLDAIWGTQARFPVAPDDVGPENPYHLQLDDEPSDEDPPVR